MSNSNFSTKNRRNFFFPRNTQYQELDDFLRLNVPSDVYFNPVDENLKKTQRLFSGCDAFEPLHIVYLLVIFKLYSKEFENAYDFISIYGIKTNIYIHEINLINEWYDKFNKEFFLASVKSCSPECSEYEFIFNVLSQELARYFEIKSEAENKDYNNIKI